MYDQSFLELEEIQGDEKWSFEVLESKYLTCKGAKKWEHAEAYSNGMRIYHPNRIDGWINQAECLCELHGAEKAVEALLLDEERFGKSARYIFSIGRYYALSHEIQRAREYIKRAIGLDASMSDNLINDPSLGVIWRDFEGNA